MFFCFEILERASSGRFQWEEGEEDGPVGFREERRTGNPGWTVPWCLWKKGRARSGFFGIGRGKKRGPFGVWPNGPLCPAPLPPGGRGFRTSGRTIRGSEVVVEAHHEVHERAHEGEACGVGPVVGKAPAERDRVPLGKPGQSGDICHFGLESEAC